LILSSSIGFRLPRSYVFTIDHPKLIALLVTTSNKG